MNVRPDVIGVRDSFPKHKINRKRLFALAFLLGAVPAFAAAPKCQTQTIGQHTSKICINEVPFQHDYYTLSVDNALILSVPDDYIENVSLTHTIPEDAAELTSRVVYGQLEDRCFQAASFC
ncbi:hypothetical protein B0G76_3898 [Paraburkholderia sp. BL23I1N1]|uniref:hypothetical protein n=1 Tax=Paraburkholderia sp. BL23I1N1 TaxID=1938802 RepID=UPI000E719D2C|nr:hypothetical protein B0G76_3898 [Paraburkholderia sp. BL23I1N1]